MPDKSSCTNRYKDILAIIFRKKHGFLILANLLSIFIPVWTLHAGLFVDISGKRVTDSMESRDLLTIYF
jgi:hypothetical protein